MRRNPVLLATVAAALLIPSSAGAAGDPIMPLAEVRAGMQCTGYSVFRGQTVEPFEVEIVDVVGSGATGGADARILFRITGANIVAAGIARGFSGSPIYCAGADGQPRVAGAISESVGAFNDAQALATPIEQVIGTPVAPPVGTERRRRSRATREHRVLLSSARPLRAPLTVGGLSGPLLRRLQAAGAERGIVLTQAAAPAAPATPFAGFRPGSAVATGYTSGELSLSGIGTVTYVDGADVWAFGHSFDGAGRRSLLLQDAAISSVVVNPTLPLTEFSSYKLGAPLATVGTLSGDGVNAVAGTVGPPPGTYPVHVEVTDEDSGTTIATDFDVADERPLGNPSGLSGLLIGAPLAVAQTVTQALGSAPVRTAGELCFQIRVRERRAPMRFCNRYVADDLAGVADGSLTTVVGAAGAADVQRAAGLLDAYVGRPLTVTGVQARITVTRGQRMAYLRGVRLPRRVRAGSTVRGSFAVQVVRGERRRIPFRFEVPARLRPGVRTLTFRGPAPDTVEDSLFESIIFDLGGGRANTDQSGPRTPDALARAIRRIADDDGVRLRGTDAEVYRDDELRIGGQARTVVRVRR